MDMELRTIGIVHSSLKRLEECPKQGDEGAPEAWVEVYDEYLEGLDQLEEGQMITLVTWLHEADRSYLQVHPRGDVEIPKRGVFTTRSPDRPNPIGLHQVRVLERTRNRLRVFPLEALNDTPVLDIKSFQLPRKEEKEKKTDSWGEGIPSREAGILRTVCHKAWERHLLSGFNGNVSIRIQGATTDTCLITCTGSAKGNLRPGDLALVDIPTGKVLAGGIPSSEGTMHLEIYRKQPQAQGVVHTHPPKLLALGTLVKTEDCLKLPIFESDLIRERVTYIPDHEPGTEELAMKAGQAATTHEAIHMEKHGLVCWGKDPEWALSLSEEIEHLASIHLDVFVKI